MHKYNTEFQNKLIILHLHSVVTVRNVFGTCEKSLQLASVINISSIAKKKKIMFTRHSAHKPLSLFAMPKTCNFPIAEHHHQ